MWQAGITSSPFGKVHQIVPWTAYGEMYGIVAAVPRAKAVWQHPKVG